MFVKCGAKGHSLAEDLVELLGDPDEGRPLRHLLELGRAHVGAGRPEAAEDIEHGVLDVSAVVYLDGFALRGPGDGNIQG